ncbi:MAG: HAMP domain-containing sensor histidine kinase [Sulfurovaceae bacterium]|nr:HAMP domain-containing sensor histidine kinase [Sulfurovaceae bacterium]
MQIWIFFGIYTLYRLDIIQRELMHINEWTNAPRIIQEQELSTDMLSDLQYSIQKLIKKSQKKKTLKEKMDAKINLKNRQRNDMISALAHEFRNPIAAIMGYATTLEEDHDIPTELRDRFLTKIYNNSQKIENLLARLILWNKFESGEASLHESTFDIHTLASESRQYLLEKYPNRIIDIEGEHRIVNADRTLLEVVMKNLMENALKYSKDEVKVIINNDSVDVIDKGVGISSQDIEKVTKKFYRSGEHAWDNSMGLGLAIVKKILSLHHTHLDIKSEEGKGSVFSFNL